MVEGLLLAAGSGSRMGVAKALMRDGRGRPWLANAVDVLLEGGCTGVTVVLGAEAGQARQLVPAGVRTVVADDWTDGMSASLRRGLDSLATGDAVAAVVHLVDLPDITSDVVRRVASHAHPSRLARAVYSGRPGHPVLIGRLHWPALRGELTGDVGARAYLATRPVRLVECGDLATGADIDHPTGPDQPTRE